MAKGKGRVRVETNGESARTYDVRRGEEVTVRTRRERPEVSGGGGGGGGGGDFNPLGCLFGIIIVLVILYKLVYGAINLSIKVTDYTVNAIESNVIKKFNPKYKTRHEVTEEKRKHLIVVNEKIQYENALLKERFEKAIGGKERIEKILGEKGITFYPSDNFYAIDNYVWNGGNLVGREKNQLYLGYERTATVPAVAFSENKGTDWNIISYINLSASGDVKDTSIVSSIMFLDKNKGFLSVFWEYGHFAGVQSYIFKTEDGGKDWKMVFDSVLLNLTAVKHPIIAIGATSKQHIVASFPIDIFTGMWRGMIESNDCGENWTYINSNGVETAKSCAEELIWRTEKGEIIPQF